MSNTFDPNPPSRKDEDFPKTTTIPEGWMTEELMDYYNRPAGASSEDSPNESDENHRAAPVVEDETLFTRRLEPFPTPNTIPHGWDTSWM